MDRPGKPAGSDCADGIRKLTKALPLLAEQNSEERKEHKAAWSQHALFITHTRALMASLSIPELRELAEHMDEVDQIASSYFLEVARAGADKEERAAHLQKYADPALLTWAEEARKIFYWILVRTVRDKLKQTIATPPGAELENPTAEYINSLLTPNAKKPFQVSIRVNLFKKPS